MKVIFGVENFGKIKHAEIVLGNLVLFVGENNSGKTFMMQLLYGTMSAVVQVPGLRLHLDSETRYVVNQEILQAWEKTINIWKQKRNGLSRRNQCSHNRL